MKLADCDHTRIMGIINLTPDSFYKDSRMSSTDAAMAQIKQMIDNGADAVDIGACSTRPGFTAISAEEEIKRLEAVLPAIRAEYPDLLISIDTFVPQVAEHCLKEWHVDIINDISGGSQEMYRIAAMYGATYILTYNKEIKEDVASEMVEFFRLKISELHNIGLKKVIADPGFGFSKTLEQNYQALNCMDSLHSMGCETLVGVSRKSMIYKVLHCTPQEALNGTTVLHTWAVQHKASWLRVHDVKEAVECVKLIKMINENS